MEKSVTCLSFVIRVGNQLLLDGQPFYVNGWNSYWMMVNAVEESTRPRVNNIMRDGAALGLTVCRTWAFNDGTDQALQLSPGNYDEKVFQALDYVLFQATQNGVRLLLSLVNNWDHYGGKARYVEWAQAEGESVSADDDFFTNSKCRNYYRDHVKAMLTRVNSFTKMEYRNDPAIFGWELINEPECVSDSSGDTLQAWIEEMAEYVKFLDNNHLLTVGTEGFYAANSKGCSGSNPNDYCATVGTDFVRNHQAPDIDFATVHAYPDSWLTSKNVDDKLEFLEKWVSAHILDADRTLSMPVLFAEFGLSNKKSGFDESKRVSFYKIVYDQVFQNAECHGAGAGALQWQFLPPEMSDWNDGYGINPAVNSSLVDLIRQQSSRLQMSFDQTCWREADNKTVGHKHTITKLFEGLTHMFN